MVKPVALDADFWKRFSRTIWERKSVTFKNVASPLFEMDESEIFNLLVLFSDRCRKLKNADGVKLYVSGHRQFESEALRLLPKKSDKTLRGYDERMNKLFNDYCLVCDELLQVNHAKQDLLSQFTEGLYAEVGLPNRFAEMGLYLGNYRKTPFGIHVDGCGVFSFPVVGTKNFRLWKPTYIAKNPKLIHASNYAKHKEQSQILTAKPGEMTYWPSSAWHIAESNGNFSATWSLGVWVDQKHGDTISRVMTDLLVSQLGAEATAGLTLFDELNDRSGEVRRLPNIYQNSLQVLKRLSSGEMQTAFLKAWLAHSSKQGLKSVPHSALLITPKTQIRLANPRRPLRWIFSKNESKFYYAFDGQISAGTASKSLLKIIKTVNSGNSASLKGLSKADLKIVQAFALSGAFTKSDAVRKPL